MQCGSCRVLSTLVTQQPVFMAEKEASASISIFEILQRILLIFFPLATIIFTSVFVYVGISTHYNSVVLKLVPEVCLTLSVIPVCPSFLPSSFCPFLELHSLYLCLLFQNKRWLFTSFSVMRIYD